MEDFFLLFKEIISKVTPYDNTAMIVTSLEDKQCSYKKNQPCPYKETFLKQYYRFLTAHQPLESCASWNEQKSELIVIGKGANLPLLTLLTDEIDGTFYFDCCGYCEQLTVTSFSNKRAQPQMGGYVLRFEYGKYSDHLSFTFDTEKLSIAVLIEAMEEACITYGKTLCVQID